MIDTKKLKFVWFIGFALLSSSIIFTSCEKEGEDDDYYVNVEIISPSPEAIIPIGEAFTVEVDFARQGNLIHNILIEIVDANDNQVQKLVERHAHVADAFTFKQEGIVIDEAGNYKIRATTTDLETGDEEDYEDDDDDNLVIQKFSVE